MALQKRVSELPAVTTVAGTDLLIVSSNNATKRTSVQQIGAYFAANGVAGPRGPAGPQGSPGATNYTQLTNVPATFPPSAHGHTIADVTGLQSALDGKQAAGSYATLVGGKVPESQLPPIVTTWEGLTGKPSTFQPSAHSHTIGDVTGLQTAIDGKAASSHTHTISNVTGLQTALDAKATPADVTTAVASVVNAAPASLDTLKELADALGNDANFASTVTNAIAGKAAAVHTHTIANVTGLQTALDGKQVSGSYSATVHTHGISDVTGLQTALDGKQASGSYAAASHTHQASSITDFASAVAAASPEEVVEYTTAASFPASGNGSLLYLATDSARAYRWVGSQYAEIGPTSVSAGGGSSADSVLRAIFVPPAPTSLTASPGNAQATLSWSAPSVIAQAPITDYVVQFSSDSGSTWTTFADATSTATSATVTGLTNGTAYVFRVAAVNAVGTGAYTAASSAATPGAANLTKAASGAFATASGSGTTASPLAWSGSVTTASAVTMFTVVTAGTLNLSLTLTGGTGEFGSDVFEVTRNGTVVFTPALGSNVTRSTTFSVSVGDVVRINVLNESSANLTAFSARI